MASFVSRPSRPSQVATPSTGWNPIAVLDIGVIHDRFHCIGLTRQNEPCANPISKENRTHAKEILRTMSAIAPSSNSVDEEDLEELLDILLCWRHKQDTSQLDSIMGKWQRAIERVARRREDEIFGEAEDSISTLDADISDLMERRLRLVKLEGDGEVKSQGCGGGRKGVK